VLARLFRVVPRRELDEFSRSLAHEFAEGYTPEMEKAAASKKTERRLERTRERVIARAARYHAENRLGFYAKARLGNEFKWALRELGFSDDFVDEVTRRLVVTLSRG